MKQKLDWESKTVLVTGGAGFIGRRLVGTLARLGSKVYVLDDLSSGVWDNTSTKEAQIVVSNVTSINSTILTGLEGIDLVYHLGAPSSDLLFREDPTGCLKDTVLGFMEVIRFAAKKGVKKLVYASSSSVYGDSRGPQSENTPTNPTNLYGTSKLICETIAGVQSDVPSIGLRIFAGYGPGESTKGRIASVVTLFMESLANHQAITLFGDGSQCRDFIYVDDIIHSFIRSAEIPDMGVLNVGSGNTYSFTQIVSSLEDVLGVRGKVIFAPAPSGYFTSTLADITRMKSRLGLEPIALREGLASYMLEVERAR
ncbi:MAG: NAD-dependent epimerase/dehydratase family protein [Nitrososphaerales archaeon]